MEILTLKDSVEKDTFFRKLPNLAEQLPRQIVLKKVGNSDSNVYVNMNSILYTFFPFLIFILVSAVTSFISFCP
jgi:UDP:flavonoid glycosyltransferase YjiC (YdhE family)